MKKIDVNKSLIFSRNLEDLKNSLDYLYQCGYFSNSEDFSDFEKGNFDGVYIANFTRRPYECRYNNNSQFFSYFIPESEVVGKEEPKKLRPFKSTKEFFDTTGFKIGEVVHIKRFVNYNYEETSIFNGFRVYTDEDFNNKIQLTFGAITRSFSELFKNFKYYKNGEWSPFGIEE